MLKKTIKKEGGFTLLELLIVIVIIGILALLIIPNITSAPKKARDTQRKTDLRAIQKGLEEYFVSNNTYPATLDPLSQGTTPIMKDIPVDPKTPKNGTPTAPWTYVYTPASDSSSYVLDSCLENSGDNGTDVVAAVQPCTTKSFELKNNN